MANAAQQDFIRERRLAALSRLSGDNISKTSASCEQHNPQPARTDHGQPSYHPSPQPSFNPAPQRSQPPQPSFNPAPSSNVHTLSSMRASRPPGASGGRLQTSSKTQVITESNELYVRLPSKNITSEQLVQFIRTQVHLFFYTLALFLQIWIICFVINKQNEYWKFWNPL